MTRTKKVFAMLLALSLVIFAFAACGGTKDTPAPTPDAEGSKPAESTESKEETGTEGAASDFTGTLHIFNSKGENAAQFDEMVKAFSEETGIAAEAFSVGAGTDASEPLRAQMNSKNPPAIFSMQGLKELPEWQESGAALDLTTVTNPEFKALVDAIPEGLRLSPDGSANYGIPYNVEGYGYIVDPQMIADLFGADNSEAVIKDLRTASYADFTAFVETLDAYIKEPSALTVTLNGNEYALQAEKTGLAANLHGVFAFAGAEKWTYGDHTVNVALNSVFSGPEAAANATDEQFEALKKPLEVYAKTVDFVSSHVGGMDGAGHRGPDLISSSKYGYDQSVQAFADGNAVFLQQGNWAAGNIENINPEVSGRVQFVPVKMDMTDDLIQTGRTAEQFNSSIPVFVPNFYAVNAKADPAAQEAAMQFLVWMHKPENVQKYVIDSFKFIPYNADSSMTIEDSLGKSIMTYMEEGNTLTAPYHGAPGPWSGDTLGKEIMENYLTKETWTEEDYAAIADFAIQSWKDLR